jgi:hypothetical protein
VNSCGAQSRRISRLSRGREYCAVDLRPNATHQVGDWRTGRQPINLPNSISLRGWDLAVLLARFRMWPGGTRRRSERTRDLSDKYGLCDMSVLPPGEVCRRRGAPEFLIRQQGQALACFRFKHLKCDPRPTSCARREHLNRYSREMGHSVLMMTQ